MTNGERIERFHTPSNETERFREMRPAHAQIEADFPTLLVVDDEQSILSLCGDLAADCGWNTETARSTDEALTILRRTRIDCVITDIRVPTKGGIELIINIRDAFPTMKIFVLSQYGSVKTAVEAIRVGAIDFITKPFVIEDFQRLLKIGFGPEKKRMPFEQSRRKSNRILDVPGVGVALYDSQHRCLAISDVLAGVALPHLQNLAPSQNQLVCQSAFEPVVEFKDRSGASLTSRENETLKLVAEGKCNKEIATALGLSPKTIDTYRQRIMSKLDLHSQSDLIRYAIRRGLAKP